MPVKRFKILAATLASTAAMLVATGALAGPVFLTGHDPDFHAQGNAGAVNLLRAGLNFVTGGTYNSSSSAAKFLWVESALSLGVPSGHLFGQNALTGALALTLGVDFDRVDGAGFGSVTLANYSAIAIASSFGGTLRRAELDALIARQTDIENFINAGGGLFASAECSQTGGSCGVNLLGGSTAPDLFGYLPINVTSIGAAGPFTVTPYGSTTFGLVNGDLNSPTHNSFGATGGLNIVDTDAAGNATTLAGIVTISGGGFNQTPEPGSLLLAALALGALMRSRRRARPD